VSPDRNLVTNIGVGADATHTIYPAPYLKVPTEAMRFPLVHPPFMVCDWVSDKETYRRRLLPEQGTLLRSIARHMYYLVNKQHTAAVKLMRGRLVPHRGGEPADATAHD
jgi:hypothetical protein